MRASVVSRFENLFMPVPECGCWIWIGSINEHGYGGFSFNLKRTRAHRVSWLLYRGRIPEGISVLHECNTPSCVNPNHLFLGTQRDNLIDCWKKGRHLPFQKTERKFSNENVSAIRKDRRQYKEIAKDYKISISHISGIKNLKSRLSQNINKDEIWIPKNKWYKDVYGKTNPEISKELGIATSHVAYLHNRGRLAERLVKHRLNPTNLQHL